MTGMQQYFKPVTVTDDSGDENGLLSVMPNAHKLGKEEKWIS